MNEFSRLELLLGKETMKKLQNKTILIFGLGGVGGYAAEALARSGVKHLILVDYDFIDITNLNRQIIATYDTIGMKKVDVMKKRIESISRQTKVTTIDQKITLDNIDLLLREKMDYLIDAEDTMDVKKELIRRISKTNLKALFVMGTGNKIDPFQFKITDIRKTSYDPVSKMIRKMVKDEKIKGKIMVLSSTEEKRVKKTKEIPSNAYIPSIAGLLASSYVINDVIQNESSC